MLLQATNISYSYGDKPLLKDCELYIDEHDKIGVLGSNGAGKSTLLHIIASLDTSACHLATKPKLQISYLTQTPSFDPNATIASLFEGMDNTTQYHFKSYLNKFQIEDHNALFKTLSGGQTRKVALALTLAKDCDLLILDEPTNHLDMEMILWLEKFLMNYKGAILMVSHDRYLLEHVTSTIIEVENAHLYTSKGGYSDYLEAKAFRQQEMLAKKRKRAAILRVETAWAKAGIEARRTKSKDRLERWKAMMNEKDDEVNKNLTLSTTMSRMGRKTIILEDVSKSYDDKVLFDHFSYLIQPYDRIGILGHNGCGKSTLLNIITGHLAPDTGEVIIGDTMKIGYFDQLSMNLDDDMKVYDYIYRISDRIETDEGVLNAKSMLNMFLFDDDLIYTKIGRLSGGQKRRLYLLSVLMTSPNVLILDEPTNDLDVETLSTLEDFIEHYKGIVLTVSHDRYFLDKIVDKMFAFEEDGLHIYNGNCSDYLLDHELSSKKKVEPVIVIEQPKVRKLSYQEKKELENLKGEVEALELKLAEIAAQFEQDLDFETISTLSSKQAQLEEELETKSERWLELLEIEEMAKA